MRNRMILSILVCGIAFPLLSASADERVEGFLAALTGEQAESLRGEWASAREEGTVDADAFLHRALGRVYPVYARAVRMMDLERHDRVEEIVAEALEGAEDPYLVANLRYWLARSRLAREEIEGGIELLDPLVAESSGRLAYPAEARFYLGFAYHLLPDAARARAELQAFLDAHPDAPERYREQARMILEMVETQGDSPLLDIAQRMQAVRRRIIREETGEETQRQEEEITEMLQLLIDQLMKEQPQGDGSGPPGGNGPPGPGGGPPGGNTQPGGPANSSELVPGPMRLGSLNDAPSGSGAWGLPQDQEREQVYNYLKDKYPARYGEMLDEYWRALAGEGE